MLYVSIEINTEDFVIEKHWHLKMKTNAQPSHVQTEDHKYVEIINMDRSFFYYAPNRKMTNDQLLLTRCVRFVSKVTQGWDEYRIRKIN